MEKVLDYLRYNYLICFDTDENDLTFISGSSNLSISSNKLRYVNDFVDTMKFPSFKHSSFIKCFELLSKEKGRLSENQKKRLASTRGTFKKIKESLLEENGISLETTQILFVVPLDWTEEHYKDKLRAFFLDMDWITPEDNESKLVMIPSFQLLVESFQHKQRKHLDRERTSLLFSMQEIHGEDKLKFTYTFFKMQSAKELIAVSKTLASGDFLLVPFIVKTESINLASVEYVMYNALKKIIARIQGKDPKCASDEDIARHNDPAWKIACKIPRIQDNKGWIGWQIGHIFGANINFKKRQLEDLLEWTFERLTAVIYEDVETKNYFKQVSSFFRRALDECGAVRDSPDGIQHIFLHSRHQGYFYSEGDIAYCIEQALVKENIIQPGAKFLNFDSEYDTDFAMQPSHKMVQIANAILPPVIVNVNDQEQNDSRFQACKPADNLIAPNSFYVQANVTETHISFILNKVIEDPSSKTGIGLFTVQERSMEIEDIVETASYLLWNHYQAMNDIEEQQHGLFECCLDHDTMVLLSSHYKEFKKNARKLIKSWFAAEDTFSAKELDTHCLVLIDQRYTCALKLSRRLLMEVGLKPAIANIATTITSALFSNDYFGLYQLSALILEKNFETIKNLRFLCAVNGLLKQSLEEYLEVHHNRLLLLFQDKCANNNISQYLGRGDYSQVSSMAYTFKIKIVSEQGADPILGLLEGGTCKKLPLLREQRRIQDNYQLFVLTYRGLAKEEDLPLNGVNLTFLVNDCEDLQIEVWVSSDSRGGASQHLVGLMDFGSAFGSKLLRSSFSVKVLPLHYSLALKFVVSANLTMRRSQRRMPGVYEAEGSINVNERLFLKK
ncbi:hypothetical protein MBANPS3_000934 [Mucor bainieri]